MPKPLVSMALACYNQQDFLEKSVSTIENVLKSAKLNYEIILFDDGSTDKTPEIIKSLASKNKKIRAFFREKNLGRGKTTSEAISKARGNITGFIDTDLESDVRAMPELIKAVASGYDIAIGNRTYQLDSNSIFRFFLSRGYHYLLKLIVGTRLKDTEAGFKFFNTKSIIPVLKEAETSRWFWDTEIMVLSERRGLKIKEIWVPFIKNREGKTTMRFLKDISEYWTELFAFRKRLKGKRL